MKSMKKFLKTPACGCKKTRKNRGRNRRKGSKSLKKHRGGYNYSTNSRNSKSIHSKSNKTA